MYSCAFLLKNTLSPKRCRRRSMFSRNRTITIMKSQNRAADLIMPTSRIPIQSQSPNIARKEV